jgi:hypothetical protein
LVNHLVIVSFTDVTLDVLVNPFRFKLLNFPTTLEELRIRIAKILIVMNGTWIQVLCRLYWLVMGLNILVEDVLLVLFPPFLSNQVCRLSDCRVTLHSVLVLKLNELLAFFDQIFNCSRHYSQSITVLISIYYY